MSTVLTLILTPTTCQDTAYCDEEWEIFRTIRLKFATLVQLGILLMAGSLSSAPGAMVAPVFPDVVQALRITPLWAGMLVSIHTLTVALATPLLGILANRIGHRLILVGSLLAYALFGGLGATATSFWPMFGYRAMVGVASGGIAVVSIGILSSRYEGEARARMMGYTTSALATATVLFPLLSGWVGSFGWQYAFFLHGLALPLVPVTWIWLEIPKSLMGGQTDLPPQEQLWPILQRPTVLIYLLALAIASALFYVVVVYAPLFLKSAMNAPPLVNGAVLATRAVGAAIISAFGATKLAQRFGDRVAIALGFGMMAVSLTSIPFVASPTLIVLSALPFGLGFGIVMPTLYNALSIQAPVVQRTAVLAIGTGISSFGQFVSPALFGPVWAYAGSVVFWVAGGIGLLVSGTTGWIKLDNPSSG